MVKLLEIGNKFQTFHSFRGNPCPYVFSTNPCECSKTHLVSEMGTLHRDFWLFYKVWKTLSEMDFPEGNPPHSHLGLDFLWDNIMSHLNYPSFLPGELIHHLRAKAKGMIITQWNHDWPTAAVPTSLPVNWEEAASYRYSFIFLRNIKSCSTLKMHL